MSCLNPQDVQSRHIMTVDGHAESLYAGCGMRGGAAIRVGASATDRRISFTFRTRWVR